MKIIKRREQGELFDALIDVQNDNMVFQIVLVLGKMRYYFGIAKRFPARPFYYSVPHVK